MKKTYISLCITAWLSVNLTACTPMVIKPADYQAPALVLPGQYKYENSQQVDWQKIPKTPTRHEQHMGCWWLIFEDAELDRLLQQVAQSNQSIAQAQARYRQAQALVQQAQSQGKPSLGAAINASSSNNSQQDTNRQLSAAINASWMPDLWGRMGKLVEAERAGVAASEADLAAIRLNQQVLAAQAYFNIRVIDRQIELLNRTLTTYQKSLSLINNQYQAGLIALADAIQAETQLQSVNVQLTVLQRERALQENVLAVLVGQFVAEFGLPKNNLALTLPEAPIAIPSVLLNQRPDVISAERSLAATHLRWGLAQTAWLPNFNLTANTALNSNKLAEILRTPDRVWSLGASMAATMLDGGLRQSQIAQAQAQYEQQWAVYQQAVLTGWQEVESSLVNSKTLAQQARQQQILVALAQENERVVNNRYQAGLVNYLEVATAQNLTLNSERDALTITAQRLNSTIALIAALGGNWNAKVL